MAWSYLDVVGMCSSPWFWAEEEGIADGLDAVVGKRMPMATKAATI